MKIKLNTADILNCPLMKKISKMDIPQLSTSELNSSLVKITAETNTPVEKAVQGAEMSAVYSKAAINIKNKNEELINNIKNILEKNYILEPGEHIHRTTHSTSENAMRLHIGDEISGFKGLYNDNKRVCTYFSKDGKSDKIFIQNKLTGDVDILDCATSTLTTYSKSDVEALKYYKYHPDAIHSKLRHNKNMYSGSWKIEMESVIEKLTRLFSNKTKVFKTSENTTLYRALQSDLTETEIQKLSKVGEIFTEKSFCSTTTDLQVAKRFSSGHPILEIDVPKGSEYIDVEKIFNIDRQHWREAEFLLNKDSKFLVTGFDKEKNIIKVKYLFNTV